MNDGQSSILRIERQLVICVARKRSDKIIQGLIEQCMMFILRLSFYLTHTLYRLVLQNVLCSARTAGKWTEKPALARAMASGKARIAQVTDKSLIIYTLKTIGSGSFTHSESSLAKRIFLSITDLITCMQLASLSCFWNILDL